MTSTDNNIKLIGITSKRDSLLYKNADINFLLPNNKNFRLEVHKNILSPHVALLSKKIRPNAWGGLTSPSLSFQIYRKRGNSQW